MRPNTRLSIPFFAAVLALCHAGANTGGFTVTVEPLRNFTHVIDEPVDVRLTIRNLTGQPLRTAAGDRLTCNVERLNARDRLVTRYADAALPEVELQPGGTWQGYVRLTDLFKMRLEGDYFVRVGVANRLGSGMSDGTILTLAPGTAIKEVSQMFADGSSRVFRLVYLQDYKVCEYLYLRIMDPDNVRAWDTIGLGVVFRVEEAPKLDIQDDGTVTVIHRATRDYHVKTTLASSRGGVQLVGQEELLDPEALARLLMGPIFQKALEPPPPVKKSWWKFW